MEIDENLQRAELSPAQEAAHLQRRKEVWAEINGSKTGKILPSFGGRGDVAENFSTTFVAETSSASGKTERAIRMAVARGRDLGLCARFKS